MEQYTPKFSDPRVLATTKRALSFVALYTKDLQKVWISRNELYRHFGNTSRPLGKYLKEHLLIEADSYYNAQTGTCKKYTKNSPGILLVEQAAGLANHMPKLTDLQEQQLETGDFDYLEKSDRLYNNLQYIPKQVRGSLMANKGYRYHYDIEAAASNLLVQKARKLAPDLALPDLDAYNLNRTAIRDQIAVNCAITNSQVKLVINGVLQGGVVTCWQGGKIFQSLNYSYNAITNLKHDPVFQGIQTDIRSLWKVLKEEFPKRYVTNKNGVLISQRLSSKEKSQLYRELENQVGDVIRKLLRKRKIKCLWIHDGWCSDGFIDPLDVELEVRRATGYSIKLEWNKYEDM
jgi:hypothetical protein